jgi:hypothetical protein
VPTGYASGSLSKEPEFKFTDDETGGFGRSDCEEGLKRHFVA